MHNPVKLLRFLLSATLCVVPAAGSQADDKANPMVRLTTNYGELEIELYKSKAPVTVDNFLRYVKEGFYDGTIFHRVIPNFMNQGGGFEPGMKQKQTHSPIENEADNGLKNERGTLAMARTNDPHSATSQFFINTKDNDFLNHTGKSPQGWGYAVFARVTKGMETVDKIAAVPTGNVGMHGDVPKDDVVIQKAEVIE
jgi:peptidyl-prolyl cis-trans isomerase B (cyclophilin B)